MEPRPHGGRGAGGGRLRHGAHALIWLALIAQAACAEEPPATAAQGDRIARVTDGDTVVLERLGRTRLIGIDTPEVRPRTECFGPQAARRMRQLAAPGTRVTYRFDAERRDRYGRALVYLHAGGRFVNADLVRGGFAAPLRVPPNTRHAGELDRLAGAARDAGRGLWGAC